MNRLNHRSSFIILCPTNNLPVSLICSLMKALGTKLHILALMWKNMANTPLAFEAFNYVVYVARSCWGIVTFDPTQRAMCTARCWIHLLLMICYLPTKLATPRQIWFITALNLAIGLLYCISLKFCC